MLAKCIHLQLIMFPLKKSPKQQHRLPSTGTHVIFKLAPLCHDGLRHHCQNGGMHLKRKWMKLKTEIQMILPMSPRMSVWISYVKELLKCAVDLCQNVSSYREALARTSVNVPPPISSNFERADKEALVPAHTRRFNILLTLQ
nr:uncharacterized protein LOC129387128 [Dermacentor andersoni]